MTSPDTRKSDHAEPVTDVIGIGTSTSKKPPPVMSTWKICLNVKSRSTGVFPSGSAIRSSSRPVDVAPMETPNSTRARSAQKSGSSSGAMYQNETTPHTRPAKQRKRNGKPRSKMTSTKWPRPCTPGGRPLRPRREMAATIRMSCAVFEMDMIVSRSTNDLPVRASVPYLSMPRCSARPPRRQKRKSGSTESRLLFCRKEPLGKVSSSATTGSRRMYPTIITHATRQRWNMSESSDSTDTVASAPLGRSPGA